MILPFLLAAALLRLIFIGNSYTFYNDLPELAQRLSETTPGLKLKTEQETHPGWTLQRHWLEGKARARIRERRWDVVVLQEHSTRPITDAGQFAAFAQLFNTEIRGAGARPMLYMTWARRFAPENQAILTNAYRRVGAAIKAPVAPAGEAWKRWLAAPDAPRLHIGDDSHPNFRGSFLNALVIVGKLRGTPLTDAPTDYLGLDGIEYPVDGKKFDGRVDPKELPRLLQCAREALAAESAGEPSVTAHDDRTPVESRRKVNVTSIRRATAGTGR